MPMSANKNSRERGASVIVVSASAILLLGFAALAVDLGAGFNERRQDQTAADLTAMAIVVEATNPQDAVTSGLAVADANLEHGLTPSEWQAAWETCTDTLPTGFSPMPAPVTYSVATLQCVSVNPSVDGHAEVRVTLPIQTTETAFAGLIGTDTIATTATAHGAFVIKDGGDVLPFGLEFGTSDGAQCISTSPSGNVSAPCTGPTSGNFGSLDVPLHGNPDKYAGTTADCSPDLVTLASNAAIGLDHFITAVDSAAPGAGTASTSWSSAFDDAWAVQDKCSTASGSTVLTDTLPTGTFINTLETRTGFVFTGLQDGLIGDILNIPGTYAGELPRLQRLADSSRYVELRERTGPTNHNWELDNTPIWFYLRDVGDLGAAGIAGATSGGVCHRNQLMADSYDPMTYFSAGGPYEDFTTCLANYQAYVTSVGAAAAEPLFVDALADNPRFAWAPEFLYTPFPTGGAIPMPIHEFRPVYLDNLTFDCVLTGGPPTGTDAETECNVGPGQAFSPGQYPNGGTPKTTYTNALRLDQITSWVIPKTALPEKALATYPSGLVGPFAVELVR